MMIRIFSLAVAILGLSAFSATPVVAEDKKEDKKEVVKDGDTHEGWVVKAGSKRLVMMGKDKKEMTHDIGEDTKIMLDGKAAHLEDLKEKTHIMVTMKDKKVTKVEGHTKDKGTKDEPK